MVAEPSNEVLVNEILGLSTFSSAAIPRSKDRQLQYWKFHTCPSTCSRHRDRKGWVTTGPSLSPYTAIEYTNFMEGKHAVPLDKSYGTDIGFIKGRPDSGSMFDGETRFKLLLKNNGLHEMPDDQIIAYGWHRLPIVQALRPHIQVVSIPCEYGCPDRIFNNDVELSLHVKAMHIDSAGARAVGKQIEKVIERVSALQGIDPMQLAQIVTQTVLQFESNKAQLATIGASPEEADIPILTDIEETDD